MPAYIAAEWERNGTWRELGRVVLLWCFLAFQGFAQQLANAVLVSAACHKTTAVL